MRRIGGFGTAVAGVVYSAVKLHRLEKTAAFDKTVEELRSGPIRRGPWRPDIESLALSRLHHILPPFGMGRCLKRSLVLLDLWSARGIEAKLCLGSRQGSEGQTREGHAWLEVVDARLAPFAGNPAGEPIVKL